MPEQAPTDRRVTIRDVAEKAGVSISTVSHVFSGRRRISPATQDRVLAAAALLGYGANPAARALRTGRSGLIGLILRPRDAVHGSVHGTETFIRLAGAIAAEVLERKLALVHVPDILDPAAQRVPMDGCIVVSPYGNDEVVTELLRQRLPVVTAEEDPDRPALPWTVAMDHGGAVTDLLDGLHLRGAQAIMLITGTEDNAWNRRSRESYLTWTQHHHITPRVAELYEGAGAQGARELIEPLLHSPQRPDAIVAASSRFAAGIADSASHRGLTIPDDLMLAALTDSAYTRSHTPSITSVDLALEELARASVELMVRQLDGAEPPEQRVVVRPCIHWRPSTANEAVPYPATESR